MAKLATPKLNYRIIFVHSTERLPHNVYLVHSQIKDLSLGRHQLLAETQAVFAGIDPLLQLFAGPSLLEKLTFWRNRPYCGNYTEKKLHYASEFSAWVQDKL